MELLVCWNGCISDEKRFPKNTLTYVCKNCGMVGDLMRKPEYDRALLIQEKNNNHFLNGMA